MNTIINFIKKGELGNIKIGQAQNSVEEYLGIPEGISHNKSFITLKYGSLQLSFYKLADSEKYILKHIHMDFDKEVNFPTTLNLCGWCPTPYTTYYEFVKEMEGRGISLYEDKQHTFKDIQIGIKSDIGVIIIFDDEDIDNKIISMSLFNPSK